MTASRGPSIFLDLSCLSGKIEGPLLACRVTPRGGKQKHCPLLLTCVKRALENSKSFYNDMPSLWPDLLTSVSYDTVTSIRLAKSLKNPTATGLVWGTNMAAVSLFWDTNMAAMTSCENTQYRYFKKYNLSFCAQYQSCRLSVTCCWNN